MANEAKTNMQVTSGGMIWPLVLSAWLLIFTAVYIWWKTWNPKEVGDWEPGNFTAMLKFISIADMGQFVSGIAGALVFIWIIYTYRSQREELALQREEMQAQRKEFEKLAGEAHAQSLLLEQTAATNMRDAFIRSLDLREREMALIAGDLIRMTATQESHTTQLHRAWQGYERGDRHAFFRSLISQVIGGEHKDFMKRASNVVGARYWMEWLSESAQQIVSDAQQVDETLFALCTNTPWNRLALLYRSLLKEYPEPNGNTEKAPQ